MPEISSGDTAWVLVSAAMVLLVFGKLLAFLAQNSPHEPGGRALKDRYLRPLPQAEQGV